MSEQGEWNDLVHMGNSIFAIDPTRNRLFYVQNQYILGVFEGDITKQKVSLMKKKIVLANSRYTTRLRNIWVDDDAVLWSPAVQFIYFPTTVYYALVENEFIADEDIVELDYLQRMRSVDAMILVQV